MEWTETIRWGVLVLILGRWGAQWWLEWLNKCHTLRHSQEVPAGFRGIVSDDEYANSVDYTLAKTQFARVEFFFGACLLIAVLWSGILPWWRLHFTAWAGSGVWASAMFLFLTITLLSVFSWPLDWWYQFRLEERFGFNKMTARLWWIDRLKGFLLSMALVVPLAALLLVMVDAAGRLWWLWGWVCLCFIQLCLMLLAPRFILPLFNKFTPLPEGSLKKRLLDLGHRTGFHARNILVMDGSRRSTHSNAFFTGLGKFRQIVLFDTLVSQLSEPQLESVLAHEIGHYKKGHVPKMLLGSALGLLAGFYGLSLLIEQPWFYQVFGFAKPDRVVGFLLFALLGGVLTFWIQPVTHFFSRLWEYEADAYAAKVMKESESLVGALRKLNLKNLSNLTPHPLYSRFYYSHPTLIEREKALNRVT